MSQEREEVLALLMMKEFGACKVGLRAAKTFLTCAGRAVTRSGDEDMDLRISELIDDYCEMSFHIRTCRFCRR